ncbi:7624_t:CDS:1, partial [Dentiscutata heterogama]
MKGLIDEIKNTYTTMFNEIKEAEAVYKKDILDNMRKAKELMDEFKNTYTRAMFNEIRKTNL